MENNNQAKQSISEKAARVRKSKEERIAKKQAALEKAELKASKIKQQIKLLLQDKVDNRKEAARRKIIAGAVVLKMIKQGQTFNKESFKAALLASLKNEADKAYFEKIFNN